MAKPIDVAFVEPFPDAELFAYRGGFLLKDDRWLFAIYVVDRAKRGGPSAREGIYIFERAPDQPAVARAINPRRLDPPAGLDPNLLAARPITPLSSGCFERGMGGSLHYVAQDKDGVTFIPIEGPGALE